MRKLSLCALLYVLTGCAAGRVRPETIIALERAALDRWGNGDPEGYLSTYAPDVTYFDPFQPKRVDSLTTMRALYGPIKGQVRVPSYDMVNPLVQQRGDVAVLTFNLVSHAKRPDGQPMDVRWNSTEVYRRDRGTWKIIHSHWSFVEGGRR